MVTSQDRPLTRILILAANPLDSKRLDLSREVRDIQEVLARGMGEFEVQVALAVRRRELREKLLSFKPQYVHFCGHGGGERGIVLHDESDASRLVGTEELSSLFRLFRTTLECVFLNCCLSRPQAKAIARSIKYVIGTSDSIGDAAAVDFSVGFYQAIGALQTVPFAFDFGLSAIAGVPESRVPILIRRSSEIRRKRHVPESDFESFGDAPPKCSPDLRKPEAQRGAAIIKVEKESSPNEPTDREADSLRSALSHFWNRLQQKRQAIVLLGTTSSLEGSKEGEPYPSLEALAARILKDEGISPRDATDFRKDLREVLRRWNETEDLADFLGKYLSGEPGPAHYYLAALAGS